MKTGRAAKAVGLLPLLSLGGGSRAAESFELVSFVKVL
jgi:hypothetical protein